MHKPNKTETDLLNKLREYEFYHVIQLTESIVTPGVKRWQPYQAVTLKAVRQIDYHGKRVLDIGCRDGLFSFEVEKLGAAEIIGIDNNLSRPATEFLIPYFDSKVRMVEMNVRNLSPDRFGLFDVVIFSGVLYHLREPFTALKNIRDVLTPGGKLIIESVLMVDNNKHALLHCPVENPDSSRDKTSCTFFNLRGLSDTLLSFGIEVEKVEWLNSAHKNKWAYFKSRLPSRSGKPKPVVTDRATLVCRNAPGRIDPVLEAYWYETHKTGGWK